MRVLSGSDDTRPVHAPDEVLAASFRDPSGFVYRKDGLLYRAVNNSYADTYCRLMDSGLYDELVDRDLLIPHEEVPSHFPSSENVSVTLRPETIPFISYPYEWCFSQMKAAAAATLEIQNTALTYGMSLKDCSAYNIQFRRGKPVLIDTLSFDTYVEGHPWVAYRQFCQHFLAPLLLMSYKDVRLNQLSRVYIDGCPLDLASALLPRRSWLKLSSLLHLHLHAGSQKHFSGGIERHRPDRPESGSRSRTMSKKAMLGLVDQLRTATDKLQWKPAGTEWVDYYDETNYSEGEFDYKQKIVRDFLIAANPRTVWDLGANTGLFSKISSELGIETVAFDIDPAAVELHYLDCAKRGETNILPLLMDLSNPSPGTGWENRERMTLPERGPADTAMALALVHHLAISNNVPLTKVASFFEDIGRNLIIEFVPKADSQVQRLLAAREDVFPDYTLDNFEKEFSKLFDITSKVSLSENGRVLYSMVSKTRGQA